jgi:hypothetical protein
MRTRDFSAKEYEDKFSRGNNVSDNDLPFRALQHALDIRKFEIDLYWKRAAYFWTFIAATFGGFVAIQASGSTKKTDLSVLLCNLGIVFSFGWLCVNRGSKYWQENWENHVDMLEDSVIGPLYKVILSRPRPRGSLAWMEHLLTGPSPISVSKINQLISLFVTLVWLALLLYSLPRFSLRSPVDWYYVVDIVITVVICIAFLTYGKTHMGGYSHCATIRSTCIENSTDE